MNQHPEATRTARSLARALKTLGIDIKHTQALEVLARMDGARNLATWQARDEQAEDASKARPLEGIYAAALQDWQVGEVDDAELSPEQRRTFGVRVERTPASLLIDLALPHCDVDELEGTDQLTLMVEVNNGKPCVHIAAGVTADTGLSVFGTAEGLQVRFDEDGQNSFGTMTVPADTTLLVAR